MSASIFDLDAVRDLIVDKQPVAVIVVDTNILIDYLDFTKWKTSLGVVIFVLPTLINIELERIKRKNQDKQGLDPASEAIRAYRDLCRKGSIHRGIHLDGVGWFVSVPIPMEDRVAPALKQWATAGQYGRPDLMFLLLTMELAQLSSAPVIFATTDSGLFGIASGHGIPAYYFQGFPINDLNESLSKLTPPAGIDFKQFMSDIQQEAEMKKAVTVDLILTAKREIPRSFGQTFEQWLEDSPLPQSPLLFAEGIGTLDRDFPFSWSLSYSEWDYPFLSPNAGQEFDPRPEFLPEVYLDFGERKHEVSDDIKKALEEKLDMLTFPFAGLLGLPTVIGPESILKFFFYITYLEESLSSKGGTEDDVKSEFAEEYRAASSLADFGARIIFWRLGIDPKESRVDDSVRKLFVAFTASWGIGDRKVIQLFI